MQDGFHETILCLSESVNIILLLLTAALASALARFFLWFILATAHSYNHIVSDAIFVLSFGTFLLGCRFLKLLA